MKSFMIYDIILAHTANFDGVKIWWLRLKTRYFLI